MSVETPVEMSVETGGSKPAKRRVSTADQVLRLLRAEPELSLADVAAVLGCSVRTVERAAANLQAQARLRHSGPTKGGRWEVVEADGS
jgi:ATP-dependent DNA helicase RecG